MRFTRRLSLTLVSYISLSHSTGLDPINNFCSRWYHQSQVKNGILYIDGGILSFSDRQQFPNPAAYDDRLNYTGSVILGPNNYLIAVNLSTSWDWKTNISEVARNKSVALGTSNYVPNVQSAALFQGASDDPQIYLYGGVTPSINTSFPNWQGPTTNQYTLWGFNTESGGWTQYDVLLDVPQRPSWGAATEIPERGLAFYLNGLVNNMSSPTTENAKSENVEGMVVLDLQKHTATNRSTNIITSGAPRVRGGLIYIPQFGNAGVLISLGGGTGPEGSVQPVSMSEVGIFDVESTTAPDSPGTMNGWNKQSITGGAPAPRLDFCVVLATAPDKSSFNIYLYGGWDPSQNHYLDDVWIYEGSLPRYGHTCHFVTGRQMITVGGLSSGNLTQCDWEWMSVAVYDLTLLQWGSSFRSETAAYQVPSRISDVIGGGLEGGATKLLPDGGWTSTLVAKLFTNDTSQTAPYKIPGSPGNSGNSTATPAGTNPLPNQTNTGAIAGGVVGGSVLILIVALALYWRRKRSKRATAVDQAGPTAADEPKHLGEQRPSTPQMMARSPDLYGEISHQALDAMYYPLPVELRGSPVSEIQTHERPAELEGFKNTSELAGAQSHNASELGNIHAWHSGERGEFLQSK